MTRLLYVPVEPPMFPAPFRWQPKEAGEVAACGIDCAAWLESLGAPGSGPGSGTLDGVTVDADAALAVREVSWTPAGRVELLLGAGAAGRDNLVQVELRSGKGVLPVQLALPVRAGGAAGLLRVSTGETILLDGQPLLLGGQTITVGVA